MRPYLYDEEYSVIYLGDVRSPGVVKLSGHDRDKAWDVKPAKGSTGASSALNGDPLGEFTAEFSLAADSVDDDGRDDFDRWEDFQRLIESTTNGPRPVALPVYHPDLSRNRFTEVVNRGVGGMIHDGRGGAIVIVKFGEHKPPKPKPVAKAQSKPDAQVREGRPDPNQEAKARLASLVEEARRP